VPATAAVKATSAPVAASWKAAATRVVAR
jgi:hypothetical protein